MAHDSYLQMISMSLDEMLTDTDQEVLFDHMRSCAMCADTWTRMNALDRLLTVQKEVIPPPDFVANVMTRVSTYQERRKWYPWMVVTLIVLSLLTGISLLAPTLFFSLGIYRTAAAWPAVGRAVAVFAGGFAEVVRVASFLMDALLDWLSLLSHDPVTLGVVIAALVSVSTYIGLRETIKATSAVNNEAFQQQSV